MTDRTLLRGGIIGSVVAALCCGTPVLAVVLGALGLSAWIAWADYVILPGLVACIALTGYALYRRSQRNERHV
jgi:mercuric ion transport protein